MTYNYDGSLTEAGVATDKMSVVIHEIGKQVQHCY